MTNLLDILHERIVLGDGATGTYLYSLGVPRQHCLEEVNLSQPDLVQKVHQRYVDAGSQVIMTNSFGANRLRLSRYGLEGRVNELNWKAARLAKEAVGSKEVLVGGSVGPLMRRLSDPELSRSEQRDIFQEQMGALLDGGCDCLFIENFSDVEELLLALDVYQNLTDKPVITSLAVSLEGRLLSGQDLETAWQVLRDQHADIVGINATVGPMSSVSLLARQEVKRDELISVYPNAGKPEFYEGYVNYAASPHYFAEILKQLVEQGARLIGGDYGTGPEHIEAMAQVLPLLRPVREKKVSVAKRSLVVASSDEVTESVEEERRKEGVEEPSLLELLKERPVSIVELDSPKTLSMEKFLEGAQALKKSGVDAITLADNSLAILRVSNVAAAVLLREKVGVTPLIHLACRDRNLLGMQSDLMGLSVLGFRHVLALTGDPAKVGDHPGASSVYDLQSVKLIRLMNGMNSGVNAVGRDLKKKSRFIIGCAFNPNARNFDSQLKKLESKIAEGAQYILTQPVFDSGLAHETGRALAQVGIPFFTGVMPLLSSRNAEFLHNEVPGIRIPDSVREKLRHADAAKSIEIGLELAHEIRQAILEHSNGVYIITPFLRYELSQSLVEASQ